MHAGMRPNRVPVTPPRTWVSSDGSPAPYSSARSRVLTSTMNRSGMAVATSLRAVLLPKPGVALKTDSVPGSLARAIRSAARTSSIPATGETKRVSPPPERSLCGRAGRDLCSSGGSTASGVGREALAVRGRPWWPCPRGFRMATIQRGVGQRPNSLKLLDDTPTRTRLRGPREVSSSYRRFRPVPVAVSTGPAPNPMIWDLVPSSDRVASVI